MLFSIHRASRYFIKNIDTKYALQQDDWNDYGFQTAYRLYFRDEGSDNPVIYLGSVKILRKNQASSDPILIREPFNQLAPDFCSVGNSLDYYQRLNSIPRDARNEILTALHDVVAYPKLVPEFENEAGWSISLFRDNSDWRDYLDEANAIYSDNFDSLPDIEMPFSFRPSGDSDALELDFHAPEPDFYTGPYRRVGPTQKRILLPKRVVVLIGRNGSGKSTLLSRIARIAYASPDERTRSPEKDLGSFEPNGIGFMRVITISYSAFDSFTIPGMDDRDLRQAALDTEKGQGRFVYCGLRDIVAEVRAELEQREAQQQTPQPSILSADSRGTTKLKSIDQLGDEFEKLIVRISKENRTNLLHAALTPLISDPSFAQFGSSIPIEFLGDDPRAAFMGWSTGHKIALHVVASLVANATKKSLVLFDEPEMHLHPPLTAALMHAVRIVLEDVNAFGIVATHSPVVLQETLAKHVRLISRNGDSVKIEASRLETFGENLGVLTYDIFGLTATSTDFHQTLNLLAQSGEQFEEIDNLFTPGLSSQAQAYILSRIAARSRSE